MEQKNTLVLYDQQSIPEQFRNILKEMGQYVSIFPMKSGQLFGELHKIQEWTISHLQITDMKQSAVIKQISMIQFSELISINLLEAEQDEFTKNQGYNPKYNSQIKLGNNNINSCRSLRKTRWSNFESLNINDNKCNEIEWLFQMRQIFCLCLELHPFQKTQSQSITGITRIIHEDSRHVQCISFSKNRIKNRIYLESMYRKCEVCVPQLWRNPLIKRK